ncbi:MAG TPA: ABC transporter ATP-binding protein [Terriglobales bacterium]|nr:ABC transporter ATP-binding protein [Terriglobales bacterium]
MIECTQLRKEFGDVVAVRDLSLTIPEKEIYGLIGPNGAGKTTTIRLACGLLTPTLGTVRVAGVDVNHSPEEAQQYIGYLADFFSVYENLKVWEYVDYFAHAYKLPETAISTRVAEVIAEVNLESKRDAFIAGLSRGMKQRLGIARAIIHRPKVLLLDEPASGLDPKARIQLRELLCSLRDKGTTILISSHILTELEGLCTSIGIMEKGRLVRSGKMEEIAADGVRSLLVRMAWVGDSELAEGKLRRSPLVSEICLADSSAVFRFSGSEEELSGLLAMLVGEGIRVISFGEVKQTVEDVYMKISRHEVT